MHWHRDTLEPSTIYICMWLLDDVSINMGGFEVYKDSSEVLCKPRTLSRGVAVSLAYAQRKRLVAAVADGEGLCLPNWAAMLSRILPSCSQAREREGAARDPP